MIQPQLSDQEKTILQNHHSKSLSNVESKLSELQAQHGHVVGQLETTVGQTGQMKTQIPVAATEKGATNVIGANVELYEENVVLVSKCGKELPVNESSFAVL